MAAHPIRITYKQVPAPDPALKAGFSVSSRNFKKAVDRNRIKRLMRESYRRQKPSKTSLAIFIIYTGKELPTYKIVDDNMKLALQKLSDQLARQKQ